MKLSKILENLPDTTREELDAADETALKNVVVQAEEAIASTTRELEANEQYQAAKAVAKDAKDKVKDLSAGLKETKKYQNSKIHYSLRRLRVLAGDILSDDEE